ncbi:hypothetical protein ACP70R_047949 [Stipagrostis hirtigluma subsp. patula]
MLQEPDAHEALGRLFWAKIELPTSVAGYKILQRTGRMKLDEPNKVLSNASCRSCSLLPVPSRVLRITLLKSEDMV